MDSFFKYLDEKYKTQVTTNKKMTGTTTDDFKQMSKTIYDEPSSNTDGQAKADNTLNNWQIKNDMITGESYKEPWYKDWGYKIGSGVLDFLGKTGNAMSGSYNEPFQGFLDTKERNKQLINEQGRLGSLPERSWNNIKTSFDLPRQSLQGIKQGWNREEDYWTSDSLRRAENVLFGTDYLSRDFEDWNTPDWLNKAAETGLRSALPNKWEDGVVDWAKGLDTASLLGFGVDWMAGGKLAPRTGRTTTTTKYVPKAETPTTDVIFNTSKPNVPTDTHLKRPKSEGGIREFIPNEQFKGSNLEPHKPKIEYPTNLSTKQIEELQNISKQIETGNPDDLAQKYANVFKTETDPKNWMDINVKDKKGLEWLGKEWISYDNLSKAWNNPATKWLGDTKVGQSTKKVADSVGSTFNRGWQKAGQIEDVKTIPKRVDNTRSAGNVDIDRGLEKLRTTMKSDPVLKKWNKDADSLVSLMRNSPTIKKAIEKGDFNGVSNQLRRFNEELGADINIDEAMSWLTEPDKYNALQKYNKTYQEITDDTFNLHKSLGLATDEQYRPDYVRQRTFWTGELSQDELNMLDELISDDAFKSDVKNLGTTSSKSKLKRLLNARDKTKVNRKFQNYDEILDFNKTVKDTMGLKGAKDFNKNAYGVDEWRSSRLLGDMYQSSSKAVQNRRLLDSLKKSDLVSDKPRDNFVPANFSAGQTSEPVYMHKDVWEHLEGLMTEDSPSKLRETTKFLYRYWKPLATVAKPAFTVGNKADNIIKNYMAGYDSASMAKNMKVVTKILNPKAEGNFKFKQPVQLNGYKIEKGKIVQSEGSVSQVSEMSYQQLRDLMKYEGIADTGRFGYHGDMEKTMDSLIKEAVEGSTKALDFAKHPVESMRKLNSWSENRDKVGLFLHTLDKEKTSSFAKETVDRWLFNYNDLTKSESWIRDTIMPFYTYSRKTLPLMTKELASNPKDFMRYGGLQDKSEQYAEDRELRVENENVPDYIKDRQGFRLPWDSKEGNAQYWSMPMSMMEFSKGLSGGNLGEDFWEMKSPIFSLGTGLFNNTNSWGDQIDYKQGHGKEVANTPEQFVYEGISKLGGDNLLNKVGIVENQQSNDLLDKWMEGSKFDFTKDIVTAGTFDMLDRYFKGGNVSDDVARRFINDVDYDKQKYSNTWEGIRNAEGYNKGLTQDQGYYPITMNEIPQEFIAEYKRLKADGKPIPESLIQQMNDWYMATYMSGR